MNLSSSSTTTSSSSSSSTNRTIANSTIGVGLASFSSSTTPFSSNSLPQTTSRQTNRQQFYNNQNNSAPNYLITSSMPSSSTTSTSNLNSNIRNTTILQQPSTSAVSSSSSPISSAQNLSSTTRDWFTYVYKIDNIEDLIRSNDSSSMSTQQNFVQSQIFSFTNHIINTPSASSSTNTTTNATHLTTATTNQISQSSNIGGSGGIGVALNNCTSNCMTNSSSNLNSNSNTQNNLNTNSTSTNKQASNWRLIFYPNGAGSDCKNFLSIFLKYLSDEPVKIQMMFSIVDNNNEDVYVKYTVNKFNKLNDWGFKQLIHKNAILFQKDKFLKAFTNNNSGSLSVRVKMRLDEQKHDYIKKLNDNLHYCKLLSENFSQYYYNNASNMLNETTDSLPSSSSASSSSNNTNSNQSIITLYNAAAEAAASSSSTAASSSSILTNESLPSSSCLESSLPSSSFKPSSSNSNSTTNNTSLNNLNINSGINNSINNLNASQTSIFSNSTNSSYYDILLLVKSTNLSNSFNLVCNNCLNESQNTNLNGNNRRNYSCLIDTNQDEDDEETNEDNDDYSYYNQSNKRVKLSQPTDTDTNCSKCGETQQNIKTTELIEFRAHKCVLAARSPVFKAMFNYRLKENLTNKVIIEDCKPEVVKAMLKYIYTAYLPDEFRNIAIDLYIAAEKYFIESLKIKCRENLIEHLNTDTVIQIYILSELYNDSMLRKQSLKFISENIDKVTQNSDWNDFMTVYPQFYTNAFIRLCKKDF